MIVEEIVGTFRGYEVVIRQDVHTFNKDLVSEQFKETAKYLKEHVFNRIDNECQMDFEDLLAKKEVLQKIENIIIDEYQRYNDAHFKLEEEEQ